MAHQQIPFRIDPPKVIHVALANAIPFASVLLPTESTTTEALNVSIECSLAPGIAM